MAIHLKSYVLEDVLPPFSEEDLNGTTTQIIKAITSGTCTLLKGKANYRTDRPANLGKPGNTHVRGNSESEVSFPLDLGKICHEVNLGTPNLCINSLRMYGQISAENPLHFHGYSNPTAGAMEFVIFSVKLICPYNPESGDIHALSSSRNGSIGGSSDVAPLVLIFEENGKLKHIAPEAGDMLILPSGKFHEFSCLPRIFADISSIEVASAVSSLSGGSWKRENGLTPQQVIAETFLEETGKSVEPERLSSLTLADVPSLAPYIETSPVRLDSLSYH